MYELAEDYAARLEGIAVAIQESEVLQQYLEEEEDTFYQALKDGYEPYIDELQQEIAAYYPLQLMAFEQALLDERFEGLFLPRILGYSVLRGEINAHYKYVRQQDHFANIVRFMSNSPNFDQLRLRIGQSIQVGFALSSDITVTSLIESIGSKQVRQFLLTQKKSEHRVLEGRRLAYSRYAAQFKDKNYQSADFPTSKEELPFTANALKQFLLYRVSANLDNTSLINPLHITVANEAFAGTAELAVFATIYGAYFEATEAHRELLLPIISKERETSAVFAETLFALLLEVKADPKVPFGPEQEKLLSQVIDKTIDDKLSSYFQLTDIIHNDGYVNTPVHEAIAAETLLHDGLSDFNENIRQTIFGYFKRFADNIGPEGYQDWFDLVNKQFPIYIKLFGNEAFTQQLKDLATRYARKLIKVYTDKRAKDYREIKKTVMLTFPEWGFMTEKQLKEFFKTPRKARPKA